MKYKTLIEERLRANNYQTELEEENALKEILQELILYTMADLGFFKAAAFHGGTELRIVRGLTRFSEDLDFALIEQRNGFDFEKFVVQMQQAQTLWGIEMLVIDKSSPQSNIKKMLLKDSSLAKILIVHPMFDKRKTIKIKIELDINPPEGIVTENRFLDFPITFPLRCFDLESGFAGKLHAILCRGFLKGRDWFDFVWYIERKTKINMLFLKNALYQQGPWAKKSLELNSELLLSLLEEKIVSVNWKDAIQDVEIFVIQESRQGIKHWSQEYFLQKLEKLKMYCSN